MTWPIPVLPVGWTNASQQADVHPLAHNQLADAVNELAARMPRGWIGQGSPATDQTGIGATMVDLTGMSVAFTAEPTRRYKTTVVLTCYPSAAPASVTVQIANAAGGLIRRAFTTIATANHYATLTVVAVESGLNGAQTRKAQAQTSAGTLVIYSATTTALIVVEDIGKV